MLHAAQCCAIAPYGLRWVVALAAPFKPPWRFGNNSTGLRCTCQKRCKALGVACGRGTTIPVALGIADVHAPARDIDIPHLQSQSFAQAQGQAIEREEEHPLTQNAGGGEYPLGLLDRDDVRQALSPGRLDQTGGHPRLTQHVCVIKLQPVQAKFD